MLWLAVMSGHFSRISFQVGFIKVPKTFFISLVTKHDPSLFPPGDFISSLSTFRLCESPDCGHSTGHSAVDTSGLGYKDFHNVAED